MIDNKFFKSILALACPISTGVTNKFNKIDKIKTIRAFLKNFFIPEVSIGFNNPFLLLSPLARSTIIATQKIKPTIIEPTMVPQLKPLFVSVAARQIAGNKMTKIEIIKKFTFFIDL